MASRSWEFYVFLGAPVVPESVSTEKNTGTGTGKFGTKKSTGIGNGKIWYRKFSFLASQDALELVLVSESVSQSVTDSKNRVD